MPYRHLASAGMDPDDKPELGTEGNPFVLPPEPEGGAEIEPPKSRTGHNLRNIGVVLGLAVLSGVILLAIAS